MNRSNQYILNLLPTAALAANAPRHVTRGAVLALGLTPVSAATLQQALLDDSRDFYYSACLSMVDAIRGLIAEFHTWATVKCYYSAFYAARALLALDRIAIYYVKGSPYWIEASPGSNGKAGEQSTHGFVLDRFSTRYAGTRFVSQDIALTNPIDWLTLRREDANYNIPRFCEPQIPEHFKKVCASGVRKSVHAYLTDSTDLYTFDKDHAMIAYPLALIVAVGQRLKTNGGLGFSNEELKFLIGSCCDAHGDLRFATTLQSLAS